MRYLLQALPKGMVRNSAGGVSFGVDDWTRLDRFLILGSEAGSYYATERALTIENAAAVIRCLREDGRRTVERVAELSESGRAARNSPAIFALALAIMTPSASPFALRAISRVCRTGSHLLALMAMLRGRRGFGRALRRGLADWYGSRKPAELAYQLLKYRQRNGWTHRDVLRLSHAVPPSPEHHALYRYAVGASPAAREVKRGIAITSYSAADSLPALVLDYEKLRMESTEGDVCRRLEANSNLSWEMVPARFLGSGRVWSSLFPNLALSALLRNLGRMTSNGALAGDDAVSQACARLTCREALNKARLHPISILTALQAYRSGVSKGELLWRPIPAIEEALSYAFYLSFGFLRPAARRTLVGLDVSGSMSSPISGMSSLSCRVAATAMAMVNIRIEPWCQTMAFCDKFIPLDIRPTEELWPLIQRTERLPFGGTDCALPMLWALQNRVQVDTFIVYTDSETWQGKLTAAEALRRYRDATGIEARLVVVGMVSNGFSIADPNDRGMLDVVGFDTAAPDLITAFSRGEL